MTDPGQRKKLERRWQELEIQIRDLHDCKVVAGDPAETEAELLSSKTQSSTYSDSASSKITTTTQRSNGDAV